MKKALLVSTLAVSLLTSVSFGADTVHLYLTGKSQGVIEGDSTQLSLGRENSIECVSFTQMFYAEPGDKGITGTVRNHYPITILKRLDKATPKLFLAWRNHEPLSATFRFFRPNPAGDGTTEQFYTIVLRNAYIAGIRQEVPNTLDPSTISRPPVERISFTYGTIETIWEDGGFTAGAEWTANMTQVPISDVNFDGVVNLKDFVILADDWMTQY